MARSTLFVPVLGPFIRSVGGFPIQREGIGASGMKETLRRLAAGGIVTLFPEGTRSHDGQLGPLKPGIAVLAAGSACRSSRPAWPACSRSGRGRACFRSLIPSESTTAGRFYPDELAGLDTEAITALIRERMRRELPEAEVRCCGAT